MDVEAAAAATGDGGASGPKPKLCLPKAKTPWQKGVLEPEFMLKLSTLLPPLDSVPPQQERFVEEQASWDCTNATRKRLGFKRPTVELIVVCLQDSAGSTACLPTRPPACLHASQVRTVIASIVVFSQDMQQLRSRVLFGDWGNQYVSLLPRPRASEPRVHHVPRAVHHLLRKHCLR